MAWSDAGERLEAMPIACTRCYFTISNCPSISTPAATAYRCRYQSLTAGSLIYDHVSNRWSVSALDVGQVQSGEVQSEGNAVPGQQAVVLSVHVARALLVFLPYHR